MFLLPDHKQKSPKMAQKRTFWRLCQAIMTQFDPSWSYVGPFWSYVGPSWPILWPILELCWPILRLCWPILRLCQPIFRLCWPIFGAHLGSTWGSVGPTWAWFGVYVGLPGRISARLVPNVAFWNHSNPSLKAPSMVPKPAQQGPPAWCFASAQQATKAVIKPFWSHSSPSLKAPSKVPKSPAGHRRTFQATEAIQIFPRKRPAWCRSLCQRPTRYQSYQSGDQARRRFLKPFKSFIESAQHGAKATRRAPGDISRLVRNVAFWSHSKPSLKAPSIVPKHAQQGTPHGALQAPSMLPKPPKRWSSQTGAKRRFLKPVTSFFDGAQVVPNPSLKALGMVPKPPARRQEAFQARVAPNVALWSHSNPSLKASNVAFWSHSNPSLKAPSMVPKPPAGDREAFQARVAPNVASEATQILPWKRRAWYQSLAQGAGRPFQARVVPNVAFWSHSNPFRKAPSKVPKPPAGRRGAFQARVMPNVTFWSHSNPSLKAPSMAPKPAQQGAPAWCFACAQHGARAARGVSMVPKPPYDSRLTFFPRARCPCGWLGSADLRRSNLDLTENFGVWTVWHQSDAAKQLCNEPVGGIKLICISYGFSAPK